MRLLADGNFPKSILDALRAGGHDVLWARTDLPGSIDVAIASGGSLAPLMRVVGRAGGTWAGYISIITVEGIQMVTARRR